MALRSKTDRIIGKDVSLWVASRHAEARHDANVRRLRRTPIVALTTGAVLAAAVWAYVAFIAGSV